MQQLAADLEKHDPGLNRPFRNAVFMAATFNLSANTVTIPHRDWRNVFNGWCAVYAMGSFNYKRRGLLVLHDFKLIIQFPPGAIFLIPSAACTHSNSSIRVDLGESRYSFTCYTAGALFRWRDYGYRTEVQFRQENEEELEKVKRAHVVRRERAINLFSKYDELKDDVTRVFKLPPKDRS
jgi:hypothetical protein